MANAKFSQGMRDGMLTATSSVETSFDSGILELRDGTQPASANDVPSGNLLASIAIPADAFLAITNGVLNRGATDWVANSASGAGTATWFRLRSAADDNSLSTTYVRIDGDVSTVAANTGDLKMASTAISIGDKVTVDTFTITVPT